MLVTYCFEAPSLQVTLSQQVQVSLECHVRYELQRSVNLTERNAMGICFTVEFHCRELMFVSAQLLGPARGA